MSSHPLELILRHNGSAELVDANDNTLWCSDSDEEFKEDISDEFLSEDDLDDILQYLFECDLISEAEALKFEDGSFVTTIESMDGDSLTTTDNAEESDDDDTE